MKKKIVNIFIIYLIFQNLIFNIFSLPDFFNYWDEIIEIILILCGLVQVFRKKEKLSKNTIRIIISLSIIILIGFLGNLRFGYMNSIWAIFKDVIGFLKFPISLLILNNLEFYNVFDKINYKFFEKIIKWIVIIIFLLGIISIFFNIGLSQNELRYGIKPYQFLFTHPTFLVLSSVFLLSIIETFEFKDNTKLYLYEGMILVTIILTMRTKGFAIAGIFILVKYLLPKFKEIKNLLNFRQLKIKNVLFIIFSMIIISATVYFVGSKIFLYISFPSSPREVLYKGALTLVTKCFPFGSGFGTFASHVSGEYNSLIYEFIKVPYYWTESGNEINVLGDAGYAYYLGQLGIFGFIIFAFILYELYRLTMSVSKSKLSIIILWLYILLSLTTEAILLNNGLEFSFMFMYIMFKQRKSGDENGKT